VLVADIEYVISRLTEVKALGVRIAIDDFGTGYSSLNYLRRLPIDVLKIDRSFIDAVNDTARDRSLVASLLSLGKTLNLSVVAEGVEEASQLTWLNDNGCDYAQGFYFARPMPLAEMVALVSAARSVPEQRGARVPGRAPVAVAGAGL
jgi:EAL domain-containing protein (putative c-di-GMP-specific phosphodiesterase class I)